MIVFALIVLVLALVAGFAATAVVMRLRSFRARMLAGLLVVATLPLVAMLASGMVMFESDHDFVVMAVVAGSTAVAAVAAIVLLRGIVRPLESVGRAAQEIAAGNLASRAPKTGIAETDQFADSFNTMAESVESLFDARRQLVAWASHDLRTPLASLQAMLEAIEDGVSTADEYLPAMRSQVTRLSSLIDDLFELAMIDASALTLRLDEIKVGDLIKACVHGFEGQAKVGGVRMITEVPDPDVTIRCAPDKIERVMMNLLTNALRHTPSDGVVAITAESAANGIRVRVADSGSGMRPEETEHVFEHFYRGDLSRTSDGAGLGLAIAKGLVEAHGGKIWAENRPEGGASFSFTLPTAATV